MAASTADICAFGWTARNFALEEVSCNIAVGSMHHAQGRLSTLVAIYMKR
jgi:hypothetical protein